MIRVWALRHKPTGLFMPSRIYPLRADCLMFWIPGDTEHGLGGLDPLKPRLFYTEQSANSAKGWWVRGRGIVHKQWQWDARRTVELGFTFANSDQHATVELAAQAAEDAVGPPPERTKEMLETVAFQLVPEHHETTLFRSLAAVAHHHADFRTLGVAQTPGLVRGHDEGGPQGADVVAGGEGRGQDGGTAPASALADAATSEPQPNA